MKIFLIKLAKFIMIPFGMIYSCFRKKVPFLILMYHRVNNSVSKEISVTEEDFRWQMAYLKHKGYRVVTLDEALCMNRQILKQTKTVVLTFDDGYSDFYTITRTVLDKYGFPALIYLVPGCITSKSTFWWDKDLGESPLMDWSQLRILLKSGLTQFGSHTMTHPDFNRISIEEAEEELQNSKIVLQEKLGTDIHHFAYPRGIVGHVQAVGLVYDTAVSIFGGYDTAQNKEINYKLCLKRLPVQRSDGRLLFIARLHGWLELEGHIKAFLGRH